MRGTSRGQSRRARSLSTDSAKDVLSYNNNKNSNIIDEQHLSRDFRRRAASRQNSYLEAVNQSIGIVFFFLNLISFYYCVGFIIVLFY